MVNQLLKIFSKCYELLILTPCPQAMYISLKETTAGTYFSTPIAIAI